MSLAVEKLEGNMADLTITVPAEDFANALKSAYNKNKGKFQMAGFRKGKVPMAYIEKVYGPEVFYEDAANELINKTYPEEIDGIELDIVSRPEISVTQIEKGKDFIYVAKVATRPEVKLGSYKGIEVEKEDISVSDEEVKAEIEKAQKENGRKVDVTDRPAKLQDEVKIDFDGSVDGVAFDGGKGEDYNLVLGSHTFIDTFEDQIIGKSVGDEFDVNVTFPEDYQAENLAGKAAVFKVKLNSIKETQLPELDDEFASDVSAFDTFAEYEEDVKKTLELRKKDAAARQKEAKCIQKLIETSEMEIPEPMVALQQDRMLEDFDMRLSYQGLKLDQYLQITKMTRDDLKADMRPEALNRIKSSLVVEAVAEAEAIEVSDEEVDEEIKKMAESYQMEVEKFKEMVGEREIDAVKHDLKNRKAVKLMAESAVEVEPAEKPADEAKSE
ncbi:MAG: trigger factor [Eubacterium sp.]|nr:trigger factor [Eubacterium sp.]MBR6172276.1 trigger factor [Eubacterium sp.]